MLYVGTYTARGGKPLLFIQLSKQSGGKSNSNQVQDPATKTNATAVLSTVKMRSPCMHRN